MSSSTLPPFSLSKTFVEPTVDCQPMPAAVVNRALEIVARKTSTESRQRAEDDSPVPWSTIARVLAFDARNIPDRYREAYLDDDAVNRFLQAICRSLNAKARQELLAADTIDLESSEVRAVAFDPVWWAGPARQFQSGEISQEQMAEHFRRNLRRKGVHNSGDFLSLRAVFFPRCRNNHWTLSVVLPRARRFATLNSATADAPYTAFTRHFARPFLHGVLGDRYNAQEWHEASDTSRPVESSQQHNPTDCGAAICLCAIAIATGKTPSCGYLRVMEDLRRAIAGTLVLGDFATGTWEI